MSGMHYNYPDSQYLTDPLQMHSVTAAAFVIASFGGIGGGRSPGRLFHQTHSVSAAAEKKFSNAKGAEDLLGHLSGRCIL